MAMAFQIIASSSSSPTITKSHLFSFPTLQSSYKASKPNLSSWFSLLGSSRFSPYIGLKHLGISISPKSSIPGVNLSYSLLFFLPSGFCKICSIFLKLGAFCTEKKRRCKSMVISASLFGVGAPEALVIGVVALLVFGPKGLAEVSVLCVANLLVIDLVHSLIGFKKVLCLVYLRRIGVLDKAREGMTFWLN